MSTSQTEPTTIFVPRYSPDQGVITEWEPDFAIHVSITGQTVRIAANRAGLTTLCRHLLTLAQEEVPLGIHIHYDEQTSLEAGSLELVIERE